MISFRQLEVLKTLLATGSTIAAAKSMGLSQSGVSRLLQQLESDLSLTLFARDKGRLIPTPEASILARDAEHILLGLIHEGEGVAAKSLESLGISLEGVRSQVEEIIGQGQQAPSGHIPFTPRAKKVLELSLREALQLGHNYIGTEHILLGLIREGEGVAAQVLVKQIGRAHV